MHRAGSIGTLSTQAPYFKGLPPYLERQVDVLLVVPTGTISGSPHTFNTQVPTLNGLPHTLTTQVPYIKWFTTYHKYPGSYIKWFTTYPNYPGSYIVYF